METSTAPTGDARPEADPEVLPRARTGEADSQQPDPDAAERRDGAGPDAGPDVGPTDSPEAPDSTEFEPTRVYGSFVSIEDAGYSDDAGYNDHAGYSDDPGYNDHAGYNDAHNDDLPAGAARHETDRVERHVEPTGSGLDSAGIGGTANGRANSEASSRDGVAPTATFLSDPVRAWNTANAESYHIRMVTVQSRFVDEPAVAVAAARNLLGEAVHELAETLAQPAPPLQPSDERVDTEALRLALQGYRDLLDRILQL